MAGAAGGRAGAKAEDASGISAVGAVAGSSAPCPDSGGSAARTEAAAAAGGAGRRAPLPAAARPAPGAARNAAGSVGASKKPLGWRASALGTPLVDVPGPTICCSIASILALTPLSARAPASEGRLSASSICDRLPSAAICSGPRPSRRTRRSMSSSRLRTKSLRRLRSTISRISDFCASCPVGSWRELSSAQSVVGLATKRLILLNKLSSSLRAGMAVCLWRRFSRRTSSA